MDCDKILKFIIIGDASTGKTSILTRYLDSGFSTFTKTTIGIDFRIKRFEWKGLKIKVQIWDTAGSELYKSITSSFYRHSDGVIFVYDVQNRQTFLSIENWIRDVSYACEMEKISCFIVGNKNDKTTDLKYHNISFKDGQGTVKAETTVVNFLPKDFEGISSQSDDVLPKSYKQVSKEELIKIAKKYNVDGVYECSAKDDLNIDPIFEDLVSVVCSKQVPELLGKVHKIHLCTEVSDSDLKEKSKKSTCC